MARITLSEMNQYLKEKGNIQTDEEINQTKVEEVLESKDKLREIAEKARKETNAIIDAFNAENEKKMIKNLQLLAKTIQQLQKLV